MNTPGLGLSFLFLLATGATANCCAVDVSVRIFIPPLLLLGSPDLSRPTITTYKCTIHVKQRQQSVSIVMRKLHRIDQNGSGRPRQFKHTGARLQPDALTTVGHDFFSTLLSAHHATTLLFPVQTHGNKIERNVTPITLPTELRSLSPSPGFEPGTYVISFGICR